MNSFQVLLIIVAFLHPISGEELGLSKVLQDKTSCTKKLSKYYPMQNVDLNRLQGLWAILMVGWVDSSHIRSPAMVGCPSQEFARSKNSDNMDIVFRNYNMSTTPARAEVDHGVAEISRDRPAYWNNVAFAGIPNRALDWVLIATDYKNYMIVAECEIRNGQHVDLVALKSRYRKLNPFEKGIYMSIMEGLGWPRENMRDNVQEMWCYV